MKIKPKISVIIPVYNTGHYVCKCLESILNQNYKNLELIIIEDCSTDNSREVLKKYEGCQNVKIIYNHKNSGLSYCRNLGLKSATGEYISFIDSDDYVDANFYEKMLDSILKDKSEIAICDIKVVYEESNTSEISRAYVSNTNDMKYDIVNNGLAASACNKLFNKSVLSRYSFEEGKINEDIAVIIPTIIHAHKISYVENVYYYYIQHKSSIQNSRFSFKRFDIFDGVETTLERIKDVANYSEYKDVIVFNQLITLLLYVIPKEKNIKKRKEYLKEYCKRSQKYDIKMNHNYWNFYASCGKKHQIYFKLLFQSVSGGYYHIANLLMLFYAILSRFIKKSVINGNISCDKLVKLAWQQKKKRQDNIKISVIIPNYNYSRFLYERLYSVLYQKTKIHEIIILDDNSTDDSKSKIKEIVSKISPYIKTITYFNEQNSGSAFRQWKKGFEMASGNYIWIAEADDYCSRNLLKKLVIPIKKDSNIMISYADTAFIDAKGKVILKSIKPEIDIQKSGHWNKSYINSGLDEIKNYSFLNCTIANVSSCIIKNGEYVNYLKQSSEYKQAGDWIFYVNVMTHGKISYTNRVLNYYRVHGNNVSSTMKYDSHIKEIKKIYAYYNEKFKLTKNHKKREQERIDFLIKAWHLKK